MKLPAIRSPAVATAGLFLFHIFMRRLTPLVLFLLAAPAAAHPLPNLRHDRIVSVRFSPTAVTVKYSLEVSPFTMFLDGRTLFTPEEIAAIDGERKFAAAYAKKMGPLIAEKLAATVDGKPLEFKLVKQDLDLTDHIRCRYEFQAPWSPPVGKGAKFEFEDNNFADQAGIMNLSIETAEFDPGLTIVDVDEPSPALRNRPSVDLKPGEADRLRKASAEIVLKTAPVPVAVASLPVAPAPRVVLASGEAVSMVSPLDLAISESGKPSLVSRMFDRGLVALFDSGYGLGILLLAAFLFGAAHAFTPGHGKTLVAAYLVGERGTVLHAILLAVATTVAHTGSVIAIAAVLWSVYGNNVPGATQGVLQFAGGLLVAGVGLWLLMRRVTGKADHFHLFGSDHHHHHDHSHDHHHHDHSHGHDHHHHGPPPESAKSTAGWMRLLLMGLGGGLIPCWDAVLLLIAAMSLNQLGLAIPLLFAFSLGLGAVLVGLGVGVVYAHRAGAVKFKESRWFRMLPTVSAILLIGIGFWLCQEGIRLARS